MKNGSAGRNVAGKTAIITGGASGMGRLLAKRLAERGAKLAIVDLNDAAMAQMKQEMPGLRVDRCDVSDLSAVERTIDLIEKDLGPVEYLAHAAALMPGQSLLDMAADKINRLMAINYGGMVNLTQTVLPRMRARSSGQILIFGSIAGVVPSPGLGAYCATKAAVNSYAETLILENAGSGVHILLVCPSAVNTPLVQQAIEHGPKALAKSVRTGKNIDTPESIVDAIEVAFDRGRKIIFPGQAAVIQVLRRISPALTTKLSEMANR